MQELVRELSTVFGPPGAEDAVRERIAHHVTPYADAVTIDAMGNLYALKRGDGSGRRIMLAAHMDEIGVIVTQVEEDGMLRFSGLGTLGRKMLLGQRVRFGNGAVGVISHNGGVKAEIVENETPDWPKWFIDMGVQGAAALPVGIGDVAVFDRPFVSLGRRALGGFDDRIGCAILVQLLRTLPASPHDLLFTFTVQEEVGVRGARVAAFGQDPEIGIAVDVTPAGDTPKQLTPAAVKLGHGPAIKIADAQMIAHPRLRRALIAAAQREGIPFQPEVLTFGSTDAAAIQAARAGVISGAVSVPCRYVHTTSEMIDFGDVEHAVALLTAFLTAEVDW
ncbi:MAG: M20/M25/M40 family metallo-hydrolase [Caldilineales bacterium]|nr:M20/M25/M40 family metallo-hydrolase [Caldilineales bacterium]